MITRESELQGALRALPAPDPSPDLLPRILRSRAKGVRIAFPTRESTAPWRWIAAAAAATVLISGTWVLSLSLSKLQDSRRDSSRDPFAELLRGTVLRPSDDGGAEVTPGEPAQPKYPLIVIDDLDPSRLTEGTWTYQATMTTDDILTEIGGSTRIRLARVTFASRAAWMVNTARAVRGGPWSEFADTTYMDGLSLRPRHAIVYGYKRRTRRVDSFSGDSGHESIEIIGPMQGSYRGAVGLPFPSNAFFVSDRSLNHLSALLPAFPLARRWRGSLYQVLPFARAGLRSVTPLDLRVVGRDRVTVPAGTFDCWRVEVEIQQGETQRRTMWVSRDKGWVIKVEARGSDFVVDRLLESYEPGS